MENRNPEIKLDFEPGDLVLCSDKVVRIVRDRSDPVIIHELEPSLLSTDSAIYVALEQPATENYSTWYFLMPRREIKAIIEKGPQIVL